MLGHLDIVLDHPLDLEYNATLNQWDCEEQGSTIVEDTDHDHPNLEYSATSTQCEHEEPGSATVKTVESVKNPEDDARPDLCEDEYSDGLTVMAKLVVRDANLEYNPSLKRWEGLLLQGHGIGIRKYLELTEAHYLNDDTTNRDMGGNLIARRDPNVDRDWWQPHSPACPKGVRE